MAKTYTAVPTVTAGDVYTASAYNTYTSTNVSNLIVPPSARIVRTTNQTGYTSLSTITFQSSVWDTDGMWAAGSPTVLTIQTAGLYVITFNGSLVGTATITRLLGGIVRNATVIAYQDCFGTSTGGYCSMAATLSCAVGDTISALFSVAGGSAYYIEGQASENQSQTRIQATWIGRTS